MRKENKSNLDEMQKQKLLKLEEYGFWVMFWALFLSILIQLIAGGEIREVAGEIAVLFIGGVYMVAASLKNGLWTGKSTPTRKGNAVTSIIPAIGIGILNGIRLIQTNRLEGKSFLIVAAIMAAVYLVCFVVLEVFRTAYKKQRSKLDNADDENEG